MNERGRADEGIVLSALPGKTSRQRPVSVSGHDDLVESTLGQVTELVGQALSEYRLSQHPERQQDLEQLERRPSTAGPVLARLVQRIRHRPARVMVAWHSWADRGRVDPLLIELLQETLLSDGRPRIMADRESVADHASHLRTLADRGAQVRVHNSTLPDLLVLGREAAVLQYATGGSGAAEQHLITAAGPVASLTRLLGATWTNSVDLEVHQRLKVEHDSLPGSVLTLLSAGCTDDTAARKLDISVRTYRRYVANIMQRLNAGSRFQAGFKAARLTCNEYDDHI